MSSVSKVDLYQAVLVTTVAQSATLPAATTAAVATEEPTDPQLSTPELESLKSLVMPMMEDFIRARMSGEEAVRNLQGLIDLTPEKDAGSLSGQHHEVLSATFNAMKTVARATVDTFPKANRMINRIITLSNSVFRKDPPGAVEIVVIIAEIKVCAAIVELNHAKFKQGLELLKTLQKIFDTLLPD